MKSKGHLFYNTIIFIVLWILIDEVTFSSILLPIALSTFPDVDLHFKSHRNVFTHSVIIWLVVVCFNYTLITVLCMLSVGFHLLLDIRIRRADMRGFYTLKIYGYKSVFPGKFKNRGIFTTIWLIINCLISILILIIKII